MSGMANKGSGLSTPSYEKLLVEAQIESGMTSRNSSGQNRFVCEKESHCEPWPITVHVFWTQRDIVTSEIIRVVVIWAYLASHNLAKNIWWKKGPLIPYTCQGSSLRHEYLKFWPFSNWNVIYAIPSTPRSHELNWKIITKNI